MNPHVEIGAQQERCLSARRTQSFALTCPTTAAGGTSLSSGRPCRKGRAQGKGYRQGDEHDSGNDHKGRRDADRIAQ